jgi:hypothetical protein
MDEFTRQHESQLVGCLEGLDRVLFRGTIRLIANERGMMNWLWKRRVLLKDFGAYAEHVSDRIKQASLEVAARANRPVVYLASTAADKEQVARAIAARDGIKDGLVCVITCVHPCTSYAVRGVRELKQIRLQSCLRKCLHVYHYLIHPVLGWMVAWLQTWFPLTLKVCINGREWLGREMVRRGIDFVRRDNCFTRVEDCLQAQGLLDAQLRTDWPGLLDPILRMISPGHAEVFADDPLRYYWSADETEYATDLMFRSPKMLARLYPKLVRHAMVSLGSVEVMRFLGKRPAPVSDERGVPWAFKGEVVSDMRQRSEGVRIKHRLNRNSVKMYDKQASVLRVETTINDARDFRVYRRLEGQDAGPQAWRPMRKGVSDLHRRCQVSRACNQRYLNALAAADVGATLGELTGPICKRRRDDKGRSVRAIHPLDPDDARLLASVARGEFAVNGFRNRDIRAILHGADPDDHAELRRRSSSTSRKLRLLREHGLIKKVSSTHRYHLTEPGRRIVSTLLAAAAANAAKLRNAA